MPRTTAQEDWLTEDGLTQDGSLTTPAETFEGFFEASYQRLFTALWIGDVYLAVFLFTRN